MLNLLAHLKGSNKDPRHALSLHCIVSAVVLTAATSPSRLTCEDTAVLSYCCHALCTCCKYAPGLFGTGLPGDFRARPEDWKGCSGPCTAPLVSRACSTSRLLCAFDNRLAAVGLAARLAGFCWMPALRPADAARRSPVDLHVQSHHVSMCTDQEHPQPHLAAEANFVCR